MHLRVHHRTEYAYAEPVRNSANEVRLHPRDYPGQRCDSCFIAVVPATRVSQYTDLNGNRVHHFEVTEAHDKLVIESRLEVTTDRRVDFNHFPYGFPMSDVAQLHGMEACRPYLQSSSYIELTPEVWRRAIDIQGDSEDVFQTAYAIMEHVFTNYEYRSGATQVTTHANEVIANQCGVCQDFAHAMAAFCRVLDIPARYVSGYFYDRSQRHRMRGSQASHAWVEVFIKDKGWFGFDPTNNRVVDETYIVVAAGRDYRDVAPVFGTYFGAGGSVMTVSVTVRRSERDRGGGGRRT